MKLLICALLGERGAKTNSLTVSTSTVRWSRKVSSYGWFNPTWPESVSVGICMTHFSSQTERISLQSLLHDMQLRFLSIAILLQVSKTLVFLCRGLSLQPPCYTPLKTLLTPQGVFCSPKGSDATDPFSLGWSGQRAKTCAVLSSGAEMSLVTIAVAPVWHHRITSVAPCFWAHTYCRCACTVL